MRTLTPEEFERLYGKGSMAGFTQLRQQAPAGFDFQAAKEVFTKAGDDVSLAQQNQREQGNSLGSTIKTGATMALQGGLSVPRAFGAGLMGTETAQNVVGKTVKGMTAFGNAITPDIAQEYIGDIALKTIEGYGAMSPQEQLNQRNKLGVAEVLSYFVGGQGAKSVTQPIARGTEVLAGKMGTLAKSSDDALKQGLKLREDVRAYVGEKSVDPQVKASAERLAADPAFLRGTAKRTEDVITKYDRYLTQSEKAINDVKVDPAISEVGEKMGDAFEGVIKQRQAVGKVLGNELNEWGKLRISVKSAVDDTLAELSESGLSYNPKTRQLTSFQGSKFVPEEVTMLNDFVSRTKLLGDSPTVRQLDQLIARTRTALEFTKGESGVVGTTNAERIINGALANLKESLNPSKNGIEQLSKYWSANKTYSDLSDFVDDGATFLGKKTQSGDFAKDASIAKSAVQSILNSGKKDWMVKLEALTGYNALDDAVLALQAMKDAGDFRGLSLLQSMKDSGIPTSKAGFTGAIIDKAVDIGKRVVAGSPADQTRAFLKSLSKGKNLKVADKKVAAPSSVTKTPEIKAIEKKIAKNVDAQKVAIKAQDFTLVAKLKELYNKLVATLKDAIKRTKEAQNSPEGKRGFMNLGADASTNALNTEWKAQLKRRDDLIKGGMSEKNPTIKQLDKSIKMLEQKRVAAGEKG